MLGPAKGLAVAARNGNLPEFFGFMNSNDVPSKTMILQTSVGSLFLILGALLPSVNASYWIFSALTTQVLATMYVFMFVTALRLRYTLRISAARTPCQVAGLASGSCAAPDSGLPVRPVHWLPAAGRGAGTTELHAADVRRLRPVAVPTVDPAALPRPEWRIRPRFHPSQESCQ